jgi:nicotinate phosphoribosyltransferase
MPKTAYSITGDDLALFTDLYELTMLQSYFDAELDEEAVFSLFVRNLPEQRNYLLACGLEDVLDYLETVHFAEDALAYLRSLDMFSEPFLAWLADFRFRGDVHAVPEGTPVYGNEPILEVVAPIAQAQLIETFVINQVHLQTVLGTKGARVVQAAEGRSVIDFGARRMHGLDAALKAARAFHIAGVNATSNVLAGERYGIPIAGTMAHSYVEAFPSEIDAFRTFAGSYPQTILLVDTYDTIDGVKKVIELAGELGDAFKVRGIRLDSGDLAALARDSRKLLDKAGLESVEVFASGGLDEYEIAALAAEQTPITGFGVGTAMGVSNDVPALDMAYKLVAYAREGRVKLSPGKETFPGRKQVFRSEEDGTASGDVIARWDEKLDGRPLLQPVMHQGKRLSDPPSLDAVRDYARTQIDALPPRIRTIEPAEPPYPVTVSEALEKDRLAVAARHS